MKFYEFNEYEYYALIAADTLENAELGYEEIVADLSDEEKDLEADEITLEEALQRYKEGNIEGCETEKEKTTEFYKVIAIVEENIREGIENYQVLLIDNCLI
jgi:hypothetical protein